MWHRSARLAAVVAVAGLGCDGTAGSEQTETVRSAFVGTPASILKQATRPGIRWSLPSGFALTTDTGEVISVIARSYEFTGGYLAVDGAARDSESSTFILKGDDQSIYG